MTPIDLFDMPLLLILLPIVAFLYASVGHGGASGYLALMSAFAFPISCLMHCAPPTCSGLLQTDTFPAVLPGGCQPCGRRYPLVPLRYRPLQDQVTIDRSGCLA